MGIPVMLIGESGSGKSTSLRNFQSTELGVINVSGKPLPFRTKIKPYNCDDYSKIIGALKMAKTPSVAIDDASYLMANEFMRTVSVKGYEKFSQMAFSFWNLVKFVSDGLPEDRIVYFIGHVDCDANGKEKFKTIGKLLDDKITLEGMFTVVLKTSVQDGRYTFSTQTNGSDTVKSPMGMFDSSQIDNDLKFVDDRIREFWNIPRKNNEEAKQ